MIDHLEVPRSLHRNHKGVIDAGFEHTGELLINLATRSTGLADLKSTDVLDVGCGVRFTMTIINRKIPVRSYTGVDVSNEVVQFLRTNVEARDERFKFLHWDVRNDLYHPAGKPLPAQADLPVAGSFDLIWLFSVFTHLNPDDSLALLKLLRKHVREDGKLFFSAFIDDKLEGFEDRIKDKPLLQAFYGRRFMRSLIEESGWKILAFHDPDPANFIQHYVVCSPG